MKPKSNVDFPILTELKGDFFRNTLFFRNLHISIFFTFFDKTGVRRCKGAQRRAGARRFCQKRGSSFKDPILFDASPSSNWPAYPAVRGGWPGWPSLQYSLAANNISWEAVDQVSFRSLTSALNAAAAQF